jgi:hypothetical protein
MPWTAGVRGENLRKQQEYHSLPAAAGVEQLTEASLRNDPRRLGRIEGTQHPLSIMDTSDLCQYLRPYSTFPILASASIPVP